MPVHCALSEKNDISSRGVLGCRSGAFLGDLVWSAEEQHVYVCSNLGDLEIDVFVRDVPWKQCVVGGTDDVAMPGFDESSSDEERAPSLRDCSSDEEPESKRPKAGEDSE